MTNKILFSACLLGEKVRYDGQDKQIDSPIIRKWLSKDLVVSICPEVVGGLPIPRLAAEIQDPDAIPIKVLNNEQQDVTQYFIQGAEKTLAVCQKYQIKMAIMTDNSPSCGSSKIYDGHFSGNKIEGQGVTVRLLEKHGIKVFSHFQLELAEKYYQSLNASVKI